MSGRPSRSSPSKAAAGVRELPAAGQAKATKAGKANQQNMGDDFLAHVAENAEELSERWGLKWAEVPEAELAARPIWGTLASYISEIAIIKKGNVNAGEMYDLGTAHGIWGGLIDSAKKQHSKSANPATKARACA